ncbi:MAG: GAF domain-containing protein [Kouleothrix sp.]|nr:GAF domain-containing protein [Kouleothrix sp.]
MARPAPTPAQQIEELERQRDTFREQQERYRRTLDALYSVAMACRGHTTFREVFEVTYRELRAIFQLDACYVAVCDMRRPELFRAAYMVDEGQAEYVEDSVHGTLTGLLISQRAPLLFRDLAAERGQFATPPARFGNDGRLSRSWMGVPLLIGQSAVGVISVQSYAPDLYGDADLDLLQRLGNVVGVALENVGLAQHQHELSLALSDRVAARTDELAILSALISSMVLQRPLAELLDHALTLILPLLNVQAGNVRRYDREQAALVLLAQRGLPPDDARAVVSVPVEGTYIGSIVRDNQPLLVPDNLSLYSLSPAPSPFRSLLGVPLRIGSQVLGTLAVLDDRPRSFDPQQTDLLQVIGNQIALAIENARLLEERERQIAELRALSRISHAAATALDPTTLLRHVHEALAGLMRLDVFLMVLYDPERQIISEGIAIDEGQEYVYFHNQPPPPDSLTGWVIRERRKLHLADVAREIAQYPGVGGTPGGTGRDAEAWLGVPLFDRAGQVIGVISIQGYTPGAFDERDERFLDDVAGQVALHVQNVGLLAERARRIRELDAIGQIGQLISASYDLAEMLQRVYEQLQSLTEAAVCYLVLCEPDTFAITHSMYIDRGVAIADDWLGRRPRQGSLTLRALETRRPLLLHDLPGQRDELAAMGVDISRLSSDHNTRSWAGVPLLAKQGQPIGVISIQDYQPARYDQRTIELLGQVASHLSLGVQKVRLFDERERQIAENARLFQAEQEARRTADTLREVARVLSSSFDLGEVPQIIIRELRQVIPYDTASILMLEDEQFRLAVQGKPAGAELPQHLTFRFDQLNAAALVIERRAPVVIGDIQSAPEWTQLEGQGPLRSWLGAPLIAKGQVLGVLNISAAEPNRFTARDAEVALAFASQAAVAIENARLYQESVTRVEQELEIAARIQRNLFPRALPQAAGLELAAWILPARETGGDFYDMVVLRDETADTRAALALMIGDASGKSIPAAMLMAIARSIARSEARDHRTPEQVMRETNSWIALDVPKHSFVALCYATLDLQERHLAMANAGQLAPLRRRPGGQIEYLEAPGSTLPLGIVPDTPYATLELPLQAGDLLLFYTDGIVEAKDSARALFGFERLEAILRDHGDSTPQQLIELIVAAVEQFAGSAPQHDDMTLVALRIA